MNVRWVNVRWALATFVVVSIGLAEWPCWKVTRDGCLLIANSTQITSHCQGIDGGWDGTLDLKPQAIEEADQ